MGGFGSSSSSDDDNPESYSTEDAKKWMDEGAQKSSSAICAAVYGWDGSGKSGVCMDCRTEEEIEQGKKVVVFDLDGSAGPLKHKYFDDDENIVIFDPTVLDKEGDIDYVSMYNKMMMMTKYLLENQYELNLKAVMFDGLDKLLKTCVSGDTIIYPKGQKPMKIRDYYGIYDDLEVPIKTRDGYEKPMEAFVKTDELYKVTLQDGTVIKMTDDHPMLARKDDEELSYIVCNNLEPGMWIARPNEIHPEGIETNITEDEAWLFGMMAADDGISQKDIVEQKLENAYPSLELNRTREYDYNADKNYNIVKKTRGTERNALKDDLKAIGLWETNSESVFIPNEILWGPTSILKSFLDGYEKGGCCTISQKMSVDLKKAYTRLGNRANVQVNDYWKRTKDKIGYVVHKTTPHEDTPNDVHLMRIENIEQLGEDKVYDFKMPSGNFVANGLISSNCEFVMKFEDLKINPDARVGQQWDWGRRNRRYYQLLELIKKLECDRFFITHYKDKKNWNSGSTEVVGKEIDWHDHTGGMMFQKIEMSRRNMDGKSEFVAKIEKAKGALHLEDSEYTVAEVKNKDAEWHGLNDLWEELRESTEM